MAVSKFDYVVVGERIRAIRVAKGMSQADLAFAAHIATSNVSDIENGKTKMWLATFVKIVEALQVSADSILRPDVPEVNSLYQKEYAQLAFAPGYVLGNGSAFLLCDGGHNGEEKLALGVESPYVFLFKENLDTFFFELSDRKQAVNRVSCETADGLCYDEVDLTVQGGFNHLVKAVTAFGTRSRNALVGVNLYELPFRVLFDVLGVVVNLGFVGSELLVFVGGYSCVSGNPAFVQADHGNSC